MIYVCISEKKRIFLKKSLFQIFIAQLFAAFSNFELFLRILRCTPVKAGNAAKIAFHLFEKSVLVRPLRGCLSFITS